MFNKIKYAFKYFRYFLKSKHYYGHGIHSPFIYDFVRKVLFVKSDKQQFKYIEKYRKQLKKNNQTINLNDFGAGSKLISGQSRKISQIAATSSSRKKYGLLLSRIIGYYNPQTIVELGTSLGIGTLYLSALMNNSAKLFTIEGDKNVSEIANKYVSEITNKNIDFVNKRFEDSLPQLIEKDNVFDFVFFDGNHSEKATIEYFEQCLRNINDTSVFVFDDIHWSKGMENAWNYIQEHPKTKACIDLFQFGIVFFRKELTKQNYTIRF